MIRSKGWGRVAAFATASAIIAGSAMAQAQREEHQGGHREGGGQQAGGQRAGNQHGGQSQSGTQELIGHALSMAIESSALMGAVQQGTYSRAYGPSMGPRESSGVGTGRGTGGAGRRASGSGTGRGAGGGTGAGTGGAAGASTSAGTESTSGGGTTAGSGTGTTGSRTSGLAGQESIVSGNRSPVRSRLDPYTAGGSAAGGTPGSVEQGERAGYAARGGAQDTGTTAVAGSQAAGAGGLEGDRFAAVAGSPGMATYVYSQLQHHARRGFEDSDRLFQEAARRAGDGNSPMGRYLQAAQNYARTLQTFSGYRGSRRGDAGGDEAGDRGAFGAGASMAGMSSAADLQSVYLVNHAVKEVLDSCKIKMMCRMMGNAAEGTDILRQHAQQMHDEGMRAIQSLASTADTGGTGTGRGAAGSARGAGGGAGSGDNLLDAATAGTRDRDVNRASGTRRGSDAGSSAGAAGTTRGTTGAGGTGTTGTGNTGTSLAGDAGGSAAGAQGVGAGAGARAGVGAGGQSARGAGAGGMGSQGRAMIMLAQQAQELGRVLDELSRNDQ
ncbi:MAG: hypothetical protein U0790_15515 [Isosphaeraceae bacterium]